MEVKGMFCLINQSNQWLLFVVAYCNCENGIDRLPALSNSINR